VILPFLPSKEKCAVALLLEGISYISWPFNCKEDIYAIHAIFQFLSL